MGSLCQPPLLTPTATQCRPHSLSSLFLSLQSQPPTTFPSTSKPTHITMFSLWSTPPQSTHTLSPPLIPAGSTKTNPNQTKPNQTNPNQTKPNQTKPNQTKPES